VLQVPRSIRLAAWGTAVLSGDAPVDDALDAVTRDDEPHRVDLDRIDLDRITPALVRRPAHLDELAELLARFRDDQVPGLRAVLPAPGRPSTSPGPPDFNRLALAAGECVLTEPPFPGQVRFAEPAGRIGPIGLVPEVTVFGTPWEPGAMVTWAAHPVQPVRVTAVGSLAEAERELREALAAGTQTLARLDVARWREDAADRVAMVRDGGLPRGTLPPSAPPRAVQMLAMAARVRAIVEIAREDDGAALSGHEAEQRARTLRALEGVTRRAMAAAVNGLLEPQN
jgi:hypothetical protein